MTTLIEGLVLDPAGYPVLGARVQITPLNLPMTSGPYTAPGGTADDDPYQPGPPATWGCQDAGETGRICITLAAPAVEDYLATLTVHGRLADESLVRLHPDSTYALADLFATTRMTVAAGGPHSGGEGPQPPPLGPQVSDVTPIDGATAWVDNVIVVDPATGVVEYIGSQAYDNGDGTYTIGID